MSSRSTAGTWTRVMRVRAAYPNHLDYSGHFNIPHSANKIGQYWGPSLKSGIRIRLPITTLQYKQITSLLVDVMITNILTSVRLHGHNVPKRRFGQSSNNVTHWECNEKKRFVNYRVHNITARQSWLQSICLFVFKRFKILIILFRHPYHSIT